MFSGVSNSILAKRCLSLQDEALVKENKEFYLTAIVNVVGLALEECVPCNIRGVRLPAVKLQVPSTGLHTNSRFVDMCCFCLSIISAFLVYRVTSKHSNASQTSQTCSFTQWHPTLLSRTLSHKVCSRWYSASLLKSVLNNVVVWVFTGHTVVQSMDISHASVQVAYPLIHLLDMYVVPSFQTTPQCTCCTLHRQCNLCSIGIYRYISL